MYNIVQYTNGDKKKEERTSLRVHGVTLFTCILASFPNKFTLFSARTKPTAVISSTLTTGIDATNKSSTSPIFTILPTKNYANYKSYTQTKDLSKANSNKNNKPQGSWRTQTLDPSYFY